MKDTKITIDDLCELLTSHDTVTFSLEGLGETKFTTKEIAECVFEALDKQIAIKPIEMFFVEKPLGGVYRMRKCGNCNEVIPPKVNYCPNCGQKIDWSDDE